MSLKRSAGLTRLSSGSQAKSVSFVSNSSSETLTTPIPPLKRRAGYEMESYVPPGRKLYVVDIENVAGGSDAEASVAQQNIDSVFDKVPVLDKSDHIVVACGSRFAQNCLQVLMGNNWPKQPLLLPIAAGIDGADKKLIGYLANVQRIASSYEQVIIVSGDGIFQTVATSYRAVGVEIGVISRPSSLSNHLAKAANWVAHIPEITVKQIRTSE